MNATTMWWLLAGALVALELMTGTFYLLMLAIGAAAGALAALAGLDLTAQVVTAAAVGGLAVVLWSFGRPQKSAAEASQDQGVHLDIGETVQVQAWDDEGQAQVKYRGALWGAVLAEGQPQAPVLHRIEAISGSRLVLQKI